MKPQTETLVISTNTFVQELGLWYQNATTWSGSQASRGDWGESAISQTNNKVTEKKILVRKHSFSLILEYRGVSLLYKKKREKLTNKQRGWF